MIKEIIEKKKNKEELSKEELEEIFLGYLNETVRDYQMSAFLMAICLNGMTDKETFIVTDLFLHSGDMLDLSFIEGVKVDKHSTGGVGDKTTLVVGPIVASCGIPFIKMSGRGLGFTGGTIDKLESIPNLKVSLTTEEIEKQAKEIGLVITSQTKNLTPLDKKVYALRDATSTTESIPLIASSIMSKKIAGGAEKIVIDVKVGEGALLKTKEEAEKLGELLVKIGNHYKREVSLIYSDMSMPLGKAVGNKLEVIEATKVLKGLEKETLYDECILIAAKLISLAKNISLEKAKDEAINSIESGKAYTLTTRQRNKSRTRELMVMPFHISFTIIWNITKHFKIGFSVFLRSNSHGVDRMIARHSQHLTIPSEYIHLFMIVINEHETMGIKTMNLIDVAIFQITIIWAAIANQTRTH